MATPTPAPPGTYPTRTNVDLTDIREWTVRPSYRILAAGPIDFNVNNRGEDDHNLTVRDDKDRDLGKIELAPGDVGTADGHARAWAPTRCTARCRTTRRPG